MIVFFKTFYVVRADMDENGFKKVEALFLLYYLHAHVCETIGRQTHPLSLVTSIAGCHNIENSLWHAVVEICLALVFQIIWDKYPDEILRTFYEV